MLISQDKLFNTKQFDLKMTQKYFHYSFFMESPPGFLKWKQNSMDYLEFPGSPVNMSMPQNRTVSDLM